METTKNEVPQSTPIRKEVLKGKITVDDVHVGQFQKEGTLSAQLRQLVTTKSYYPSKKVDSNMQDNLFALSDFGFTEQEFVAEENRVAFMDVPMGTTVADVVAKLANAPNAILYRVISNHPILTDNQQYAINAGIRSLDEFAESQAVRYPEGTTAMVNGTESDVSNKLVLDKNGKIQYRRVFFSSTPKEDIDLRTSDKTNAYLSPDLKVELLGASVIAGQTV